MPKHNATTTKNDPDIHILIDEVRNQKTPVSTLKSYLDKTPNEINRTIRKKITPLISACLYGNDDIVQLLLQYNPNLKLKTKSGYPAIHIAIIGYKTDKTKKQQYRNIIDALIKKDPNVLEHKGKHGKTARHYILKENPPTPELETVLDNHPAPKPSNHLPISFFKEKVTNLAQVMASTTPHPR